MTIHKLDLKTGKRAMTEEVAPSFTPSLAVKRAGAGLSHEEFLIAASDLGLISKETAEEASDGTWPAAFDAFVRGLTPDERIRAKAKWARSAGVSRDDPLLDMVTKTKIPKKADREAALDQLFGIV